MIEVKGLQKSYGQLPVLRDIDLHIRAGEKVCIIGPSGSGKSTLLRCMNLLEQPDAGSVFFDGIELTAKGTDINAVRRRMGMVFQHFNLFPHMTVLQNITLAPIRVKKCAAAAAQAQAMALLERIGLADKANAYPATLSGGQKQRIAIMRALAMEPQALLFDEATSALDPEMVGEVLSLIGELAQTGITMVIVTHEMRFARNAASRVLFMDEGMICADGTPEEIFDRPVHPRLQSFLSRLA